MEDTPRVTERARVVRGQHSFAQWAVIKGVDDAAHNTFDALGWVMGDLRRRRVVKRIVAKAGDVVPIGRAEEGLVRIEGTVEVLEGVWLPESLAAHERARVAVYRVNDEREEPCGCRARCRAVVRVVRSVSHGGRFVVRDDTGVAVVERGAIALRDYRGNALDPYAAGRLIVREGESVTVIGHGRRRGVGELRAATARGFRDVQLPLVFEGAIDAPTYVFAPPSP